MTEFSFLDELPL